jgi:hypothetical protein
MQASKVKFSQETKAALIARPLSKQAKAKLRRERVKDYIRSQPVGTIIKQTDLAMVAGYDKSQGHGWAFINRMIAKKHITKDTSEGAKRPSWTVVGDAHTVTPKRGEIGKLEGVTVMPEEPKSDMYLLPRNPDMNAFIADMQRLGVKFTITISNKGDGDAG